MADYYEIDFLDVETSSSGDAICLRYSINGITYVHVVDGGFQDTGTKILNHMKDFYGNPSFIDNVVATHNDGDHARGLRTILEEREVGALWMLRPWEYAQELLLRFPTYTSIDRLRSTLRSAYGNLAALEDIAIERGIPIREPFQGASIGAFKVMAPTKPRFLDMIVESNKTPEGKSVADIVMGKISEAHKAVVALFRAAWGEEYFPNDGTSAENEMSVVQYANLCGHSILLTADGGRGALQEVIDYAQTVGLALPGINRFQAPHHGSRRNVSTELLDKILGPRLPSQPTTGGSFTAVISSAKADLDHPRKAVIRALVHRGANVITTEGKSIQVSLNSPDRAGWSPVAPEPYPQEQEE